MIMDEKNHLNLNMIYAVIFHRKKIQNDFCGFSSGMHNWSTFEGKRYFKNIKNFLIPLKEK